MSNEFPFELFLDNNLNEINMLNKLSTKLQNEKISTTENKLSESSWSENEITLINNEMHNSLKSKIGVDKYNLFFSTNLEVKEIFTDKVLILCKTVLVKKLIDEDYISLFKEIFQELLNKQITIETLQNIDTRKESNEQPSFVLDLNPTNEDMNNSIESKYINHITPQDNGQSIDQNKTFDNFVVGPSNNLAFATTNAVAESPGKEGRYPCLYIYSDSGLGKTHLLHSVANGIKDKFPNLVICLISAREFMKEFINAIKDKKLTEFQKKYSETVDVLMIDDIHELKNKQSTQEEFFHIFNELHAKGKQLIFTSDKPPKSITGIEERIITRLQWGLVIDIQKPDLETRIAILKKKAIELDIFLPDEILAQIANSIKTSIRELEGSLIKLKAAADVMNIEIDIDMAKEMLNIQPEDSYSNLTLESVAKSVSTYFKISVSDLKSKSRNKEFVRARHIAWYLSKKILDSTLKEIAHFYGGRDHSSVIHGINKITDLIKTDLKVSREVIYLENNL